MAKRPILEVRGLTKRYDQYLAVDRISFEIKEGEILGLLGPNGAGKSTTIQMLLGLTEPDAGEIRYFGQDFAQHKTEILGKINYASAYEKVQERLTVRQNLRIYAMLYNVPQLEKRINELLQMLEIDKYANELFWHLSSGQKTRVILAKSLLNRPKMLLMDEPTASLDPDIVNKLIEMIRELQRKEGISILFTSHNMPEVARLCDRVAFLAQGKIVLTDTPAELTKQIGQTKLVISFEGDQKVVAAFLDKKKLFHSFVRKGLVEISLVEELIPGILFDLKKTGVWMTGISTEQPSLEDVFLHISQGKKI